jgi:hypothetical protein
VAAANAANEKDGNRKSATDNQRVSSTAENRQNKEKCAHILCEIGCQVRHGFYYEYKKYIRAYGRLRGLALVHKKFIWSE